MKNLKLAAEIIRKAAELLKKGDVAENVEAAGKLEELAAEAETASPVDSTSTVPVDGTVDSTVEMTVEEFSAYMAEQAALSEKDEAEVQKARLAHADAQSQAVTAAFQAAVVKGAYAAGAKFPVQRFVLKQEPAAVPPDAPKIEAAMFAVGVDNAIVKAVLDRLGMVPVADGADDVAWGVDLALDVETAAQAALAKGNAAVFTLEDW